MKLLYVFIFCSLFINVYASRSINIMSNIYGADIYIDNKKIGNTPMLISENGKISKGIHLVSVKKDGYITKKKEIIFFNKSHEIVKFDLVKAKIIKNIEDNNNSNLINNSGVSKFSSKNPWVFILSTLGLGGIAGFCVGYASKKVAKITAFFIGIVFICIQLLAFNGLITVNWSSITEKYDLFTQTGGFKTMWEWFVSVITTNLPFGGAFITGVYLGFKKG